MSETLTMSDLFSPEWMVKFGEEWNKDPQLGKALGDIDFNSNVAYGFLGDEAPLGVLHVQKGLVTSSGAYAGEDLNWDIRASRETWEQWLKTPPNMMKLGVSYTTKKLQFVVGDYGAMIKDPRMAGPFIKSFAAMSRVA
jgi:hypothetical protein